MGFHALHPFSPGFSGIQNRRLLPEALPNQIQFPLQTPIFPPIFPHFLLRQANPSFPMQDLFPIPGEFAVPEAAG